MRAVLLRFRVFATIATCIQIPVLWSQDAEQSNEVTVHFSDASWFVNELSTALVFTRAEGEPSLESLDGGADFRIYTSDFIAVENDERGSFAMRVEFIPSRSGVLRFPSVEVSVGEETFSSSSREILVGEPKQSPAMSFSITPEKTRVFVGEPLRLDFIWRCDLPMNQLRDLQLYPDFFNNASIEVVIPRSVAPEEEQYGLPVGGRRAIARRIAEEDSFPPNMGELRFSAFIRIEEPGRYAIPQTRLLCSRLLEENAQSNRYAAYFNNALFEPADRSAPYEKLHAFANEFEIEARPIPEEGRLESFSGLFDPESISVEVAPNPVEVGQLMEIRVDVASDVCSEMLQIPDLSRQAALRNRFWVSSEVNEVWRPQGRTFVARARPLTTRFDRFPSLEIQTFSSDEAKFNLIETDPIELKIRPSDGKDFFPIENIPGARVSVVGNADGVWHNPKATMLNDFLDWTLRTLVDGVWAILALGLVAIGLGSVWAREMRKRALDEDYRRRREAYRAFRVSMGKGEDPVEALRTLIGRCFDRRPSALTARDAARLLAEVEGDGELVRDIETAIEQVDTQRYAPGGASGQTAIPTERFGERVFNLVKRGAPVLFFIGVLCGSDSARAADWAAAEERFQAALSAAEAGVGSSEEAALFVEAALAFEACGEAGTRPGLSWLNAGNAWFKAGKVGRAIANYRQAESYRPFDAKIASNLASARALRRDEFGNEERGTLVPTRWIQATFSVAWIAFCLVVIGWIRFRSKLWTIASGTALALVLALVSILAFRELRGVKEGVLIVEEAYARKGPSYSYSSAYVSPLHDGLELRLLEERSGWVRVRLEDESESWLPSEVVQSFRY